MTDRWLVTIEAWPQSTGNGADADQKAAGHRTQNFSVRAEGMAAALEAAEYIAQGMRTNPMIWRAPIVGIQSEEEIQRRYQAEKAARERAEDMKAAATKKPEDTRDWSAL
jgi:hypothetical protein